MPSNAPVPEQPVVNEPQAPLMSTQPPTVSTGPATTRKLPVIIGLVVLLVIIGLGAYFIFHHTKKTAMPNVNSIKKIVPAQVSITSAGFVPNTITIKVGQAVSWTSNDSSPHWVASDPYPTDNNLKGFNAKEALQNGGSFSFVFDKAGSYTYHDNLNPYTMRGTVSVK